MARITAPALIAVILIGMITLVLYNSTSAQTGVPISLVFLLLIIVGIAAFRRDSGGSQ